MFLAYIPPYSTSFDYWIYACGILRLAVDYCVPVKPFVVSSGARKSCPISPFLFEFVIEDVLLTAGLSDGGVEPLPGNRVFDSECAVDIAMLSDDAQTIQRMLDRFAIQVYSSTLCGFFYVMPSYKNEINV